MNYLLYFEVDSSVAIVDEKDVMHCDDFDYSGTVNKLQRAIDRKNLGDEGLQAYLGKR